MFINYLMDKGPGRYLPDWFFITINFKSEKTC